MAVRVKWGSTVTFSSFSNWKKVDTDIDVYRNFEGIHMFP